MQTRLVHWRSPLAATLILVVAIVTASFYVTGRINNMEEQSSFDRLAEEAEEFASSWEHRMDSDREQLELIAAAIGGYMEPDSDDVERYLGNYEGSGSFSRLELLLPGDVIVEPGGEEKDASGYLSFEEEAGHGAHISDRQTDIDGDGYVVRHYVPIVRGGETVAMLCGVIDLTALNRELPYMPYGGEAAVYVIDGATGDFLIDTWHNEMGNIWAIGSREMAEGYDDGQLRRGLVDGESNYVVFVSNTTREYLYFYYAPLSINEWRVALSVPEALVFSGTREIRSLLNVLLIVEGALFLAYMLYFVRYVRRETGEKQRQLDALSYIYDVEKLLFNAHEHRENVPDALEVIARMLPAKRVAFTMINADGPDSGYLWEEGGETPLGTALLKSAGKLAGCFEHGRTEISLHSAQEVHELLPGAPDGMADLAAIPVEDADGVILGVLSAGGLKKRAGCAAMLKGVGFSFAKLCGNARTYRAMQRQGERDTLTGLYNRNRYEIDLPRLAGECSVGLGCVFVDANGLHELNNASGHEAGDGMLRAVAKELRVRFGAQYAYRVGGDEFIAFVTDGYEAFLTVQSRAMVSSLEDSGYYASAGTAWAAAPVGDVEELVKTAEGRMYAAKREFYRDPAHDRRAR